MALMLFVCFPPLVLWGGSFELCLRGTASVVFYLPVVPGLDVEQYGTMQFVLIFCDWLCLVVLKCKIYCAKRMFKAVDCVADV